MSRKRRRLTSARSASRRSTASAGISPRSFAKRRVYPTSAKDANAYGVRNPPRCSPARKRPTAGSETSAHNAPPPAMTCYTGRHQAPAGAHASTPRTVRRAACTTIPPPHPSSKPTPRRHDQFSATPEVPALPARSSRLSLPPCPPVVPACRSRLVRPVRRFSPALSAASHPPCPPLLARLTRPARPSSPRSALRPLSGRPCLRSSSSPVPRRIPSA